MYLKCIRANGFKSFADKIELDINKGITAVVGPNGSGKSNVVDAIRWVLGEQSVKALRGDSSMIDCIFAGSKSRNPLSRAWVSLTFDNTDHYLNSEFNELEIKRVVYKTGENEYYINNTRVRLKDITDLFLDSGAGKESFNIISQGAIVDIINSKPEDRRVIFEEAAGVLKYKKRKEESLRKLDKTNENLARVNLLIDELDTTLEPLKEQSSKAREYLNYKEQLENIDIALIANDIEKLNKEYEQVKDRVKVLNEELERLNLTNNSDTSKVEELKLEQLKLDTSIEDKNNKLNELITDLSNLQSKKQLSIERQKYQLKNSKLDSNLLDLKEEVLTLNREYSSLTKELQDIKIELDTKQLKNIEIIKSYDDKKNNRLKEFNKLNDLNRDLLSLNNKIDILKDNIDNDAKIPFSVKNVLSNVRLAGIHNILVKLIDTNEKYGNAIEIALGSNANVIVVDDEKAAKNAINYLKENKLGRATFFPLTVIKGRSVPYDDLNIARKIDGFLGVASELVKFDDKYKDIVLNQLGNVLVVDNIDTLNKLAKSLNYKYRIVTLEGEIIYSGGAITGGTSKNNGGTINQKFELDNLIKEQKILENDISKLEVSLKNMDVELNKISNELESNQRDVILLTESYNSKELNLSNLKSKIDIKENELNGIENVKNGTLEKELNNLLEEYSKKEQEKESIEIEINKLKSKKNDLNNEILELEKSYRDQNSKIVAKQNELKLEEIKQGKMDVKLDNLLLNLNETYSLTYEKAHEDYILDIDEDTARLTVNNLKVKIKNLGEVNTGSISEFERVNERYTFLTKQRDDLSVSITSLLHVIEEMDEIMKDKFADTFEKIKKEFSVVFKKLFKGGEGILELTTDDLLSTGVEISALPPGKKLNSIGLLSGGEKTLTAIALLFSILNVKPVPFVVLDEVEAALDESNVDAFGKYLESKKDKSQFIIITHKKRTMEYADVLYGITMQESGVSKLVSVKLED